MKRIALYWQILIGMILGVIVGLTLSQFSWGSSFVQDWIKPFGNIFINSLKLIAIPLILGSLIKGISDLKDISQLSSIGLKTISLYLVTTVIAVCLGLAIVNIVKPGKQVAEAHCVTRLRWQTLWPRKPASIVGMRHAAIWLVRTCLDCAMQSKPHRI